MRDFKLVKDPYNEFIMNAHIECIRSDGQPFKTLVNLGQETAFFEELVRLANVGAEHERKRNHPLLSYGEWLSRKPLPLPLVHSDFVAEHKSLRALKEDAICRANGIPKPLYGGVDPAKEGEDKTVVAVIESCPDGDVTADTGTLFPSKRVNEVVENIKVGFLTNKTMLITEEEEPLTTGEIVKQIEMMKRKLEEPEVDEPVVSWRDRPPLL